jgi:hypothetical protein
LPVSAETVNRVESQSKLAFKKAFFLHRGGNREDVMDQPSAKPSNESEKQQAKPLHEDEERHGNSVEQAHGHGEKREGNRVETGPVKGK